ncbi:hypothetical protein BaRGS_00028352 [Batillaria attramentaria]|uniref:Uncharacterized protein n=1 Tax=Batillaria attramentaria TaxID=370345 RepID=A0ABD0K0U3_9CAEN
MYNTGLSFKCTYPDSPEANLHQGNVLDQASSAQHDLLLTAPRFEALLFNVTASNRELFMVNCIMLLWTPKVLGSALRCAEDIHRMYPGRKPSDTSGHPQPS